MVKPEMTVASALRDHLESRLHSSHRRGNVHNAYVHHDNLCMECSTRQIPLLSGAGSIIQLAKEGKRMKSCGVTSRSSRFGLRLSISSSDICIGQAVSLWSVSRCAPEYYWRRKAKSGSARAGVGKP